MANYKSSLSGMRGSDKFVNVVTLQCDCGAETLRRRIEKELGMINKSLKDYLKPQIFVNPLKKVISQHKKFERQLCSDKPSLDAMDVTLLTHIMDTFTNLSITERQNILQLRKKRNMIAHISKGKFDNDIEFNETKKIILDIAKETNKECYDHIKKDIEELENRKLVRPRGNSELIMFNGEKYMVQLIEIANKDDIVDPTLLIRLGLTKWVKELSRYIDMGPFLVRLNDADILSSPVVTKIQNSNDKEDQCNLLVLELLKDGEAIKRESVLLRFCKLLRSHNKELANLIENNNSDGKDSEAALLSIETAKIKEVLSENIKKEENRTIKTEELHILVEEEIAWSVDFSVIDRCVRDLFHVPLLNANETRYEGINWKEEANKPIEEPLEGKKPTLGHLSCEDLAEYLFEEFKEHSINIAENIQNFIIAETISSKIFVTMTETQLEDVLGKHNIKYGIGIRKTLIETQSRFQSFSSYSSNINSTILRQFDTPTGTLLYTKCRIRTATGNLLVPVHHFVNTTGSRLNINRLVNEVVKFVAACLNVRQNGTLHFGIETSEDGTGRIVGIKTDEDIHTIDLKIFKGIEKCFQDDLAHVVHRCVRPTQAIPVDSDSLVLEIDVVPYSGHTGKLMFDIQYPPNGKQISTVFVYSKFEILPVTSTHDNRKENTKTSCMSFVEERLSLEQLSMRSKDKDLRCEEDRVVKILTRGNKYITDELVPIIFSGNITGCTNETEIRHCLMKMPSAFLSSKAVFDFDSVVTLRSQIEGKNQSFKIMKANDFGCEQSENVFEMVENVWVHCNGNNELGLEKFDLTKWYKERFKQVEYAIKKCRERIPKGRALVLFLVFEDTPSHTSPMLEVARDCLMRTFRDECVVISENNDAVQSLINDLSLKFGSTINESFITGFKLRRLCELINTLFRENRDVELKLPHSGGHYVEMTKYERDELKLKDIDVISGTQCKIDETKAGINKLCELKEKEEKKFYQGNLVSWWNFYFQDQVGDRSVFSTHKLKIEDKLSDPDEDYIECHEIRHQPGAGGSTLGMRLLWELSQFHVVIRRSKAYRCCVVKNISEETAKEISKVHAFKDENPKPVVLLLDNKTYENVNSLKAELHKLAYTNAKPGTLYCLLIIINRVSTHKISTQEDSIVRHSLTPNELTWFRTKYEKLERNKVDVDTLIAFNVLRNSFDSQFIKGTVQNILKDVLPNERNLLKCVSFINSFENDQRIPPSAFDFLMKIESENTNIGCSLDVPFGISQTFNQRSGLRSTRKVTWNNSTTDALRLLIIKRQFDFQSSGISIISRPLAKAILNELMQSEVLSLENIVYYVLEVVKVHVNSGMKNVQSRQFVDVVNNLFKTRLMHLTDREDALEKSKFSDLVLELENANAGESKEQAQERVVRIMTTCFKTSQDPFVGQHLARFNLYIHDFEAAESNIKESIQLLGKPNLYLFDTYGQIYKSQMKMLIEYECKNNDTISDKQASKIIGLCFNALEKFRQAQTAAIVDENTVSYMTEVEISLILLEVFNRFKCYKNRESFLRFLHTSKPGNLIQLYANISELCVGSTTQVHLEESLRICEERDYQVRSRVYTIHTQFNESLLLKLRERFERFYGSTDSKLQFTYGLGLKPLMKAAKNNMPMLMDRLTEAKHSIMRRGINKVDPRDLLVVLGYTIIAITFDESELKGNKRELNFPEILQFSRKLVEKQQSNSRRQHLEGFLYHAMLHWPTPETIRYRNLSPGLSYENYLGEWKRAFEKNLKVAGSKNTPKIYFGLKKGGIGENIVDFDAIRKQWRKQMKEQGHTMKPVQEDNFWKEPFVEDILERLEGNVSDDGYTVAYTAKYTEGKHIFNIKTYKRYGPLSNRVVTFVLGFTWRGIIALDVELKDCVKKKNYVQENYGFHENTEDMKSTINRSNVADVLKRHLNLDNQETSVKEQAGVLERKEIPSHIKHSDRLSHVKPRDENTKGFQGSETQSTDGPTEYCSWEDRLIHLPEAEATTKSNKKTSKNSASKEAKVLHNESTKTKRKSNASKKRKRREKLKVQTPHLASDDLQGTYEAPKWAVSPECANDMMDLAVLGTNKEKTMTSDFDSKVESPLDGSDLYRMHEVGETRINEGHGHLLEKGYTNVSFDKAASLLPINDDWEKMFNDEHEQSRHKDVEDGTQTRSVNVQSLHETEEDIVSDKYQGIKTDLSQKTDNTSAASNKCKVQHTLQHSPLEHRMALRPTSSRKKRNRLAKATSSNTK